MLKGKKTQLASAPTQIIHGKTGGTSSHFGQDVTDNSSLLILCHVGQLRPGEGVVEIVLHLVVLGQTQ